MAHTETKQQTKVKPGLELREPPMFRIIYINDDTTSMEFVVESLVTFFRYTLDTAVKITEDIHHSGAAVVAVLPFEIAEQKGIEITVQARNAGYPLQIKLEPQD